jgi:spermidine export protein MdtI
MKDLYWGFIVLAAILDVTANLLLQKSDGFKHKRYGIPALMMVCLAFTLLAQVTQVIDLTIAYVSWGAMAILGTVFSARILLGQRLNRIGWLGIVIIFASIIVLKTA